MPVGDNFNTGPLKKPKHGAPGVIADRGWATRLDSLGASVSIPANSNISSCSTLGFRYLACERFWLGPRKCHPPETMRICRSGTACRHNRSVYLRILSILYTQVICIACRLTPMISLDISRRDY